MTTITKVKIHPLVLLSIADHFDRSGKTSNKRVVGTLLGAVDSEGVAEVTNCFAVPFEENKRDNAVWFLDHKFHEKMTEMFLKVNAKEKVVGWYSSGAGLTKIDLNISKIYQKYCANPILLVLNTSAEATEVEPSAYYLREKLSESENKESLCPAKVTISATEPEEIGVEQLLRDVRDKTVSSLSYKVAAREKSLGALGGKLRHIASYLEMVEKGEMPRNERVCALLREVLNEALAARKSQAFVKAHIKNSNDSAVVMYVAVLTRMVLALAELVDNRSENYRKARARQVPLKGAKADRQEKGGESGGEATEEKIIDEIMEDDEF